MAFWDSSGTSWTICKQPAPRSRQTRLLLTIVYVNKLYSLTCRQPWRHFITQFLWAWCFADAQPTLSPSLTNVGSSSDSLIHKTSIANIKKFTLHWAQLVSTEMIQKSVGGMENKWQPKFSLAVKAYPTCTWQGALECYRRIPPINRAVQNYRLYYKHTAHCIKQETARETQAAAGPRLWNSLPVQLRNPDITYGLFWRQLKGHLFRKARTWCSVTSDMWRHRKTLTYLLKR